MCIIHCHILCGVGGLLSGATMQLLMRGRLVTVSIDRVKTAYILDWTDHGNVSPPVNATPTVASPPTQPQTATRSGRHIHFLARFNI
jgi:hypothetical protein